MRRIISTGLAGVALLAAIAPSLGADLVAPKGVVAPFPEVLPAYAFSWTGTYLGLQGGARRLDGDLSADSLTGGLQAGYSYQLPSNLVLGIEADVAYGSTDDARRAGTRTIEGGIDWAGSLRGRIGYAFDRFLVYGTGGLALADAEVTARDTGLRQKATTQDTLLGWTAGLGADYALTDSVTFGAQYRYSDLEAAKVKIPGGGRQSLDLDTHDLRFGLNWKF